jgi:hypothetical protein
MQLSGRKSTGYGCGSVLDNFRQAVYELGLNIGFTERGTVEHIKKSFIFNDLPKEDFLIPPLMPPFFSAGQLEIPIISRC